MQGKYNYDERGKKISDIVACSSLANKTCKVQAVVTN